MNTVLKHNLFFVKEHRGIFKAANSYDVYDPQTQQIIMTCREEDLGFMTKLFRFSSYKSMTPFNLVIKDMNEKQVVRVKRGFSWFRSKVQVYDENEMLIGWFRQRLLTIGGKFDVYDAGGTMLCTLKGKWHSWDFKFVDDQSEFASVSKKWAGLGKELFTTADNYMLTIEPTVSSTDSRRPMILAAVMCIDFVLKEKK
jgi:uncharacterized protein YxjI